MAGRKWLLTCASFSAMIYYLYKTRWKKWFIRWDRKRRERKPLCPGRSEISKKREFGRTGECIEENRVLCKSKFMAGWWQMRSQSTSSLVSSRYARTDIVSLIHLTSWISSSLVKEKCWDISLDRLEIMDRARNVYIIVDILYTYMHIYPSV